VCVRACLYVSVGLFGYNRELFENDRIDQGVVWGMDLSGSKEHAWDADPPPENGNFGAV